MEDSLIIVNVSGKSCSLKHTVPDSEVADKIARALVTKKLAACCQIVPQVKSIYEWKGQIEVRSELDQVCSPAMSFCL